MQGCLWRSNVAQLPEAWGISGLINRRPSRDRSESGKYLPSSIAGSPTHLSTSGVRRFRDAVDRRLSGDVSIIHSSVIETAFRLERENGSGCQSTRAPSIRNGGANKELGSKCVSQSIACAGSCIYALARASRKFAATSVGNFKKNQVGSRPRYTPTQRSQKMGITPPVVIS
jgi:hypothetical protein